MATYFSLCKVDLRIWQAAHYRVSQGSRFLPTCGSALETLASSDAERQGM